MADEFGGEGFGFDEEEFGSFGDEEVAETPPAPAAAAAAAEPVAAAAAAAPQAISVPEPETPAGPSMAAIIPSQQRVKVPTGAKTGWIKTGSGSTSRMTIRRKPLKEKWFNLAEGKLLVSSGPAAVPSVGFPITNVEIDYDDGDADAVEFVLTTKEKCWRCQTRNAEDFRDWVAEIKKAKKKASGSFGASINTNMMF